MDNDVLQFNLIFLFELHFKYKYIYIYMQMIESQMGKVKFGQRLKV